MASWGSLFGSGEGASQFLLWGVGYGIAQAILGPAFVGLSQEVWKAGVAAGLHQALSPPEVADAVVRGFLDQGTAESIAGQSGINAGDFATMVRLAGEAPSPGELAVALRRELIPEDSGDPDEPGFVQGIEQGRLANKWTDVIRGLAQEWPTPSDALDALLEGQVDEATGRALYAKFGGDPDYFTMLFNTRGSAPTPVQAGEMANREIIPWDGRGPDVVSYEQAFLEGPWRDKWLEPFKAVVAYHPPPRTITAMLKDGALTTDRALTLLKQAGLSDQLAAEYVAAATTARTAVKKNLSLATVLAMYADKLITPAEAEQFIGQLGYDQAEAAAELKLADFQANHKALLSGINRIGALFIQKHITQAEAQQALTQLGVSADAQTQYLDTWNIERSANLKLPTPAQIATGWADQIISTDVALAKLEAYGYTPWDAWFVLSVKNKAKLPGEPPQGPPETL